MTRNEFANLAMTLGADIARWPDSQHAGAWRLLAAAPDLRADLVAMGAFDAAIADARPQISDARVTQLKERILAHATRRTPLRARVFQWLAAQEFTSVAAGIVLALMITSAVQSTRPIPLTADSAAGLVNPVIALLESDTSGLGVLR